MATTFDWGEGLPTIQGREVHLRPLADEDAPAMLAIFGDPEVMRFWSSPPLRDLASAVKLIGEIRAAFEGRSLFQWGVSSREGVEAIGTCTLLTWIWPIDAPRSGSLSGATTGDKGLLPTRSVRSSSSPSRHSLCTDWKLMWIQRTNAHSVCLSARDFAGRDICGNDGIISEKFTTASSWVSSGRNGRAKALPNLALQTDLVLADARNQAAERHGR
jgi:hypothetical protein